DDEAARRLREDHSAVARRGFQEEGIAARFPEGPRGREPRDAAADHHDLGARRGHVSRTRSARARMKEGEVFSDSVRPISRPSWRAACAAWTSMSNRISVWSHTKP